MTTSLLANSRKAKKYRLRKEKGIVTQYVSADETRRVLRRLHARDRNGGRFSARFLAERLGISEAYVSHLVTKTKGIKRVSVDTERKAIALYDQWRHDRVRTASYGGIDEEPDSRYRGYVDASLARRAAQGLQAQGYSQPFIAGQIGVPKLTIYRLLAEVGRYTEARIEDALVDLAKRIGSTESSERRADSSARAKRRLVHGSGILPQPTRRRWVTRLRLRHEPWSRS